MSSGEGSQHAGTGRGHPSRIKTLVRRDLEGVPTRYGQVLQSACSHACCILKCTPRPSRSSSTHLLHAQASTALTSLESFVGVRNSDVVSRTQVLSQPLALTPFLSLVQVKSENRPADTWMYLCVPSYQWRHGCGPGESESSLVLLKWYNKLVKPEQRSQDQQNRHGTWG